MGNMDLMIYHNILIRITIKVKKNSKTNNPDNMDSLGGWMSSLMLEFLESCDGYNILTAS